MAFGLHTVTLTRGPTAEWVDLIQVGQQWVLVLLSQRPAGGYLRGKERLCSCLPAGNMPAVVLGVEGSSSWISAAVACCRYPGTAASYVYTNKDCGSNSAQL